MLELTEAETQLLIALIELAQPKETPNNNFYTFYPKTLTEASTYFRCYLLDWTEAYHNLLAEKLIYQDGNEHRLTEQGLAAANQLRDERPPIWYWYQELFAATAVSPAYAAFCEQLYGKNLAQAGFSDMAQIDMLLQVTGLSDQSRVLELGCGLGMVAEYLSDTTGAAITGLDYSPMAIELAQKRTESKRRRLTFQVGNMDALDYPDASFDTIISIDTLYMPAKLDETMARMKAILTPGGQMAIFYSEFLFGSDNRDVLLPDHNALARALRQNGLAYQTYDFTESTYRLMQRKRQLAESMRADFVAEGREFLYDHLVTESESSQEPFNPATYTVSRYLYHVTKSE